MFCYKSQNIVNFPSSYARQTQKASERCAWYRYSSFEIFISLRQFSHHYYCYYLSNNNSKQQTWEYHKRYIWAWVEICWFAVSAVNFDSKCELCLDFFFFCLKPSRESIIIVDNLLIPVIPIHIVDPLLFVVLQIKHAAKIFKFLQFFYARKCQ